MARHSLLAVQARLGRYGMDRYRRRLVAHLRGLRSGNPTDGMNWRRVI